MDPCPASDTEGEGARAQGQSSTSLAGVPSQGRGRAGRETGTPPSYPAPASWAGHLSTSHVSVCGMPASEPCLWEQVTQLPLSPVCFPGLGMTPPSQGTRVPLRRPSGTALEVQWLRCLAPNTVAEWRWSVFEEIPHIRGQGRSPSKTAGGTKSHLE